jgi:hypothetical protein
MKNLVITHLFLNLYLLALVGPVLPVLDYVINYDYIVNELCVNKNKPVMACNGKCYLEGQFNKRQDSQNDKQVPLVPKLDLERFTTIVAKSFEYNFPILTNFKSTIISHCKLQAGLFLYAIFKPPISR